jgi:putative hemolysin
MPWRRRKSRGKSVPSFAAGPSTRRSGATHARALSPEAIDEFTYADPSDTWLRRNLIRTLERTTGQPRLKHMYLDYSRDPSRFSSFWDAAITYLGIDARADVSPLTAYPAGRPLVVVANHPYGVVDGLIAGYLVAQVRQDFRILTNSVLTRVEQARDYLLPVDFSETKEALAQNIATRRAAMDHLRGGGCVVIFPAGGVSTTERPFSRHATDVEWKSFVGRLVDQAGADVIPVYFPGQNSRLFQVASHLHITLRTALFFRETSRRIGTRIEPRVGEAIPHAELSALPDRKAIVTALRNATYGLRETAMTR